MSAPTSDSLCELTNYPHHLRVSPRWNLFSCSYNARSVFKKTKMFGVTKRIISSFGLVTSTSKLNQWIIPKVNLKLRYRKTDNDEKMY